MPLNSRSTLDAPNVHAPLNCIRLVLVRLVGANCSCINSTIRGGYKATHKTEEGKESVTENLAFLVGDLIF